MAQAAWKRPGSPIGRTGPRKAHPKYKRKLGQRWSDEDVRQLRSLAKGNTPTGVLSLKLQRPEAAIRSKAQRKGFRSSPPIARPTTGVPVSPSLPAIPCRRVPQPPGVLARLSTSPSSTGLSHCALGGSDPPQ
jgi:hypothetical protein